MIGFFLTLLASLLMSIFVPIGILFAPFFKKRSRYWMDVAISLDQLGNVACQHLFNVTLIKSIPHKRKYRFGKPDETISSVLGKNKRQGTLSGLGGFIDFILGKIDHNHSIKSIEEDE